MAPLAFWRQNDPPDRVGITENLHVQGYLAFWDELLRCDPKRWIDSCAGGGRRNDLESLRRSVPLLRSDYQSFTGDPQTALGNQGHSYGIASWFPYYGHGVFYNTQHNANTVRSYMSPAFVSVIDVRAKDLNWDIYRRMIDQWRQVADGYFGDYYPLTPYSLDEDRWIAWQYHRPDRGDGFVQAFRRGASIHETARLKFHGLDADAKYNLTDLDHGEPRTVGGKELMVKGLSVEILDQPGSALITYKKKT
jgi:alpha-galactosidase